MDLEGPNETRDCPVCGETINAAAVLCRYCDSGLSPVEFQECPFCKEMIRRDAKMCRHCKERVPRKESPERNLLMSLNPRPEPVKSSLRGSSLDACTLGKMEIKAFLRAAEQLTLDEKLAPSILYYSRTQAAWLLPQGQRFKELMASAFCVCVFSEEIDGELDDWCFLIESGGLCLVIYGRQSRDAPNGSKYVCSGSLDPQIVAQAFSRLSPVLRNIDNTEAERIIAARNNFALTRTSPALIARVRNLWPEVFDEETALFPSEPEETAILPLPAQAMISDIISQLRHSSDLSSILQYAIETLTQVVHADRGLIWQVAGDQLAVTNEFSLSGQMCFLGNQLDSQESTAIVLEFLSLFADESDAGIIRIPDTSKESRLHDISPTLASLIELGEVRSRLMVQLRSRGIFAGFLELQQCGKIREWSQDDAEILQPVAEMLSIVVQQAFDYAKIEMDARELKLINEIAGLLRDSGGRSSEDSLSKSIMLIANHMGFTHSQIYLYDDNENILKAQIKNGNHLLVEMENKSNPFVVVFESGRGKIVNAEFTRNGDEFFGHHMALVLPLISRGERLGVMGMWERQPSKPQFRPQDRELGLTCAGFIATELHFKKLGDK